MYVSKQRGIECGLVFTNTMHRVRIENTKYRLIDVFERYLRSTLGHVPAFIALRRNATPVNLEALRKLLQNMNAQPNSYRKHSFVLLTQVTILHYEAAM